MKHTYPKYIQVLALILVICLTGCTSEAMQAKTEQTDPAEVTTQKQPSQYSIIEENGSYYLNFSDGNEPPEEYSSQSATVDFDSLAEMQDAFLNNKLEEYQINQIKDIFPKDSQGRIQIWDMNNLQQPTLPFDLVLGSVGLTGQRYVFFVNSIHADSVSSESPIQSAGSYFQCLMKESYDEYFKRKYEDFFEKKTVHLTSTTAGPDRNSTVYDYYTNAAELRQIRYVLTVGSKTLYVDESYILSIIDDLLPVSDTVPSSIEIFGCDNGRYFHVYLSGFSERPSVEWLSSFGLTDFVKSNDTATK